MKLTFLDGVLSLAGVSFVAIVIYRYRTQGYFDLYGLLVLGTSVLIYRCYRRPPRKNEGEAKPLPANEENA